MPDLTQPFLTELAACPDCDWSGYSEDYSPPTGTTRWVPELTLCEKHTLEVQAVWERVHEPPGRVAP